MRRVRTDRHANSDFIRTAHNGIGDHPVDADHSQDKREHAEAASYRGENSLRGYSRVDLFYLCPHIDERQGFVHRLDCRTNRSNGTERIPTSPHFKRHSIKRRVLLQIERVKSRSCGLAKRRIFRVRRHPNNLIAIRVVFAAPERFPHRIHPGEELLRKRFVHYCHFWRCSSISRIKSTARQQRDTHRGKKTSSDHVPRCLLCLCAAISFAIRKKPAACCASRQKRLPRKRYLLKARQARDPLLQRVQHVDIFRCRITLLWRRNREKQQSFWPEADVHAAQIY